MGDQEVVYLRLSYAVAFVRAFMIRLGTGMADEARQSRTVILGALLLGEGVVLWAAMSLYVSCYI